MARVDPFASLPATSIEPDKQHFCKCTHCCDSDSTTEDDCPGYSPTTLPIPCPHSPLPDTFSPETHFIKKPIACDNRLLNDNEDVPATNLYLSIIPEQNEHNKSQYSSNPDRSVQCHPAGEPLVSTDIVKCKQWQKKKTVASFIFLLGLLYLFAESVNNFFYRHYQCRPYRIWNDQEPDELLLDSTLCFPCTLMRHEVMNCILKQKTSYSELQIVKTIDNKFHCCMNRFGHVKWMVNLMKTAEIIGKDRSTSDKHLNKEECLSHLSIRADTVDSASGSHLKLDKTNHTCDKINVTKDSLTVGEEGFYIIYIIITIHIAPWDTATENKQQAVLAQLYSRNHTNNKCVWTDTLTTDNSYKQFHSFHSSSFYVITNLAEGEQISCDFSHPSYLLDARGANQLGVIKI